MKKTLLLTGVLLALSASLAAAAGLNLGWTLSCPTTTNVVDQSFPCDDNGLLFTAIGTAVAPAGLSKVTAEELVFDLQEGSAQLSPWWHLEDEIASPPTPAGCRGTSSAGNVGSLSLTAAFAGATTTTCKNYWGASASGGQNYVPGYGGPNKARLQGVFARTFSGAGPLTAGVQYYVANIGLDTQHTVPDPTDPTVYVCPGCQDGVCLVFNSCKFDQPPGTANGDITVDTQAQRQFVTWQGAVGIGPSLCPAATPTHKATWGKVKSLYR